MEKSSLSYKALPVFAVRIFQINSRIFFLCQKKKSTVVKGVISERFSSLNNNSKINIFLY